MDDKAKEMIQKLLEVSKGLKNIIERQSSIIFKLHKELELHDDRIKDIYKSIKFLACMQILTLLVVGLIHATHSGWFDNIGWLQ